MILFNSICLNILFGRVVLLEFISNLCYHHFVKFQDNEAVRRCESHFCSISNQIKLCRVDYKVESTSIPYSLKMMHILSLRECNLSELEIT